MVTARRDISTYSLSLSRKILCRFLGHLLLITMLAPCLAAADPPTARDYEPVVLRGSLFSDWINTDPNTIPHLAVYRYDHASDGTPVFTAIPFQIDKRRVVNLRYNMNDPDFHGIGRSDVCEYGYFPELSPPQESNDPFVSDKLLSFDELVFMFADAGVNRVEDWSKWHSGNVRNDRYEVALEDLRTGAYRYVYVFFWNETPSDLSSADYVSYTQDQPQPNVNCPPVDEACGTVTGQPSGSLANLASFDAHFKGNWVLDRLEVKEGGSAYEDLLQRARYDSPGENEDVWSSQGAPRFLGIKDGPVRVIRGIQGAASGGHTTKYEFLYPSWFQTVVNLRVHQLTWMKARYNHEHDILRDKTVLQKHSYVHTQTKKSEGTYLDEIDGVCPGCPMTLPSYQFNDWVETISEHRGTYVRFLRETRQIPASSRAPIYDDRDAIGSIGESGVYWNDVGNTQDGYLYDADGNLLLDDYGNPVGNDGGCGVGSFPESPGYNFARLESRMIPQELVPNSGGNTANTKGDEFAENARLWVFPTTQKQIRGNVPLPRPVPCQPGITVTNPGTGNAEIGVTACTPNGFDIGYLLYRATGTEPLSPFEDMGSSTSFTDMNVVAGSSYRYGVKAYNDEGVLGPISPEVSVAVTDVTPPAAPSGLAATVGSQSATLDWNPGADRDIYGYNIFLSSTPGGPYSKLNATPHLASSGLSWSITGLTQGGAYYSVVTAVDYQGNESDPSAEVSFVPDP